MLRDRYRDLIRRSPRRELEDELRFHLETETEALIAQGMTPEAARQHALEKFGDIDAVLADCSESDKRRLRRTRRARVAEGLAQDFAYAVRALSRRPVFTISAVVALALGVGANAAVMSVVDHIFLRSPAGVREPNGIKRIFVERERKNGSTYFQVRFSFPEARIIDSTLRAGYASAIFYRRQVPFEPHSNEKRRVMSAWITPSYFDVLGVKLLRGSSFGAEDSTLGVPATSAIISWSLWQRDFNGDAAAIGRTIRVDGLPVTIRGIAPKGFSGIDLDVTDVWLPLTGLVMPTGGGRRWFELWGTIAFRVLARVPEGADERQLTVRIESAMRTAAATRQAETGRAPDAKVRRGIPAPILTSHGPENASRSEAIAAALAGLGVLLLAIATANVGNLLLGRALDRQREVGVRLALGMSRLRMATQVAMESVLLAVAAAGAALVAAMWMGSVLRSMVLPGTELATGPVDARIALFALGAAIVAGVLAALVPLFATARVDLVKMLKGSSRDGGTRSRAQSALVGVQAALSVTLLVGTGLIARSLYNIRTDDLGIDVRHGVIVLASDSGIGLPLSDVARASAEMPGVTGTALTAEAPLYSQLGARHLFDADHDTVRTIESGSGFVAAEPSYLSVVGTRITSGRDFRQDDRLGAPPVMIASAEFAQRLWPGQDPIGRCVRIEQANSPCYSVVGVAANARVFDLVEDPRPVFYVPLDQRPPPDSGSTQTTNGLVVRVSGEPGPIIARLRALVGDTGSTIRNRRVIGMGEMLAPRYEPWEMAARVFAGFAALAIVLTIVGLYGVLSYLVTIRRRELSVRLALGADQGRVLLMVLREGVAKIIAGGAVGLVAAMFAARALRPLLFQVEPRDPLVLAVAVGTLVMCALLAAALPARRAMVVDPSLALRDE